MNTTKLYRLLAFAGTLPFIICAALLAAQITVLPGLGLVSNILCSYGLVIMAFMAGSHWGQHLSLNNTWHWRLATASNVITIIVWLLYLLLPATLFLGVLIVGFIILLWIDLKLWRTDIITMAYFKTRWQVSIVVLVCLIVARLTLWTQF